MPAPPRSTSARNAVVWDALQDLLRDDPVEVLDIGGGTGGFAVHVAELGHRVTVIDPSPDALAALTRRAEDSEVTDRVDGRQGDLANLLDLVEEASMDIALCHGVLEIVEDPAAALLTLARTLRPGGSLSLLVGQHHAAVVARAMAGHFGQARSMLDDLPVAADQPAPRRFTAEQITVLLDRAGFEITAVHGVRVFADLVPSSMVDLEPGATQAMVDLERAVAERADYLVLATQLHLLATRP